MRVVFLLCLLLMSCGRKDPQEKKPELPQAAQPHDPADPMQESPGDIRSPMLPPATNVRALAPGEEVTCSSACGHLAFCNRKTYQKEISASALAACAAGCTGARGESDKLRWEAIKTCIKENPGEECAKLRECMDKAMLEIQSRLHGKNPATENSHDHTN